MSSFFVIIVVLTECPLDIMLVDLKLFYISTNFKLMTLRLIALSASVFLSSCCNAQNYFERYTKLHEANDTLAERKLLIDWEATRPEDPQLYVANLNYYVRKGSQEIVQLVQGGADGPEYQLSDSGGKLVGFMAPSMNYDRSVINKGLEYIDKGIMKFPNRLDMRFGKIYVLGELGDFKKYSAAIFDAIEYGHKIDHKWLWLEGKPREDAEKFFLETVQGYVSNIYNAEDDALLPYVQSISEAVLKYHPKHVESLSNVAVVYMINGDMEKGLPYLLKAESVVPHDVIVLNNIAECYKRMKQIERSKQYYEKMIQHGNDEDKEFARKSISQLK